MNVKLRSIAKEAFILLMLTGIMCAILAFIGYVGRASADTGSAALSPDDPVSALGQLYDFMRTGKGTAAVGVALILVVWLLRNLPVQKWKDLVGTPTGGYILVYGTALLTYVGTGLASGNALTAMMLLNAAGAALVASGGWEHLRDVVTALMSKTPPKVPPAVGAALVVLVVGALVTAGIGVGTTGCQAAKDAGQAVIDCTKADTAQIEALVLSFAPLLTASSPDWAMVEVKAEAAGETIGGCALAKVVQEYMTSKTVKTTATTWSAHDALEKFRSKVAGGATFHTTQGDL